jgi:hypothetical protein
MESRNFFLLVSIVAAAIHGQSIATASDANSHPQLVVAKSVLESKPVGEKIALSDVQRPYERGFTMQEGQYLCDNGGDLHGRRGVFWAVNLNQTKPEPIVASAWSKAEDVSGSEDTNYSIYLDLIYSDGTPLWGQTVSFDVGSHDWQHCQVVVHPEKPVKQAIFHLLLRDHGGKAWFRDPELRVIRTSADTCTFDGLTVARPQANPGGLQLRDVAAGSDFFLLPNSNHTNSSAGSGKSNGTLSGKSSVLGIDVAWTRQEADDAVFYDVELTETTGKDRAVTFALGNPVAAEGLRWQANPRQETAVEPGREYLTSTQFRAGSNGQLSRYPFGAVANAAQGLALGIDPAFPAFFRVGYSAGTAELYLAYDIGLTPEQPRAHLRFCQFTFPSKQGFRGALSRYYALYPEAFACRIHEQGNWMPFAKISQVPGWEDFGFKFKEGNDETAWDDEHGILTFRYTEPMTWWMSLPKDSPKNMDAAMAEAKRLAESGSPEAQALRTSGYHTQRGEFTAQILDTPWCNGAVWSMNSMPGVLGDVTDFKNKWSPAIQKQFYGPQVHDKQDGEYIDSSEGYVTDELDFRRDHFAVAQTPLTFSPNEHRPAIFRGLIAFEYARGIATDIHRLGKFMMANATPDRLYWLAPMLDVLGTETNWHSGGQWQPMADSEMLYRRTLCKGKPYCFLMNTNFDEFSHATVEKYMKRCLAYGMFPGFFSADAATGQYFTRPELYDRDRPLFKRYVPLCKQVAEAGWEPITLARTDQAHVYVERFGARYLTLFNDSPERRTFTLTLDAKPAGPGRNMLTGDSVEWHNKTASFSLDPEDVAVIEVPLDVSR